MECNKKKKLLFSITDFKIVLKIHCVVDVVLNLKMFFFLDIIKFMIYDRLK